MDFETQLQQLVQIALQEDGERDLTTELTCPEEAEKEGVILAKQDGTLAGLKHLETIVQTVDENILVDPFMDEGEEVRNRMMVASLGGPVRSLLRVERVMLNFLGRLSGIATATQEYVKAVEGTGAVILDTRKTIPGWRYLDKYAVTVGGGINHRMRLDDIAMIKDTHVDICGGVSKAIEQFREQDAETPLIVEVRDLEELRDALNHVKSLTRITLDNWTVEKMGQAVEVASGRILLEASGGITLENVREVAETGIHFISIGALTHSSSSFDFSFRIS